ncbi:MAG: DUF4349 domain-containing protein [Oscillospiraceae bacterium]|jgi:hypothetical protein|nr:DUF4349 domain-containing protein [Oscillospiraceae bacterium]
MKKTTQSPFAHPFRFPRAALALCLLAAVLLLAGCAVQKSDEFAPSSELTASAAPPEEYDNLSYTNYFDTTNASAADGQQKASQPADRAIITTVAANVQTKTYDTYTAALKAKLTSLGGRIDSSQQYNYEYAREAAWTMRVPSEQLDALLEALEKNGTVLSLDKQTWDATDELLDGDSKRKALEAERDALLALLQKAGSVEEIIKVQDRLSTVRGELEGYIAKLQSLRDQVAMSTVTVNIQEVDRVTKVNTRFGPQVKDGFLQSLRDIGQGFRNFALNFLVALPYLMLLAIPTVLTVLLVRRLLRKRKKRQAAPVLPPPPLPPTTNV